MGSPLAEQLAVEFRDFGGLNIEYDPNDIPEGAATTQVNVHSDRPGRLDVRLGVKQVQFDQTLT